MKTCAKCGSVFKNRRSRYCSTECSGFKSVNRTHGLTAGPEYRSWLHMRDRCNNPNAHNYGAYGGSGITVCDRWNTSFENFYADLGPRPTPTHSIERLKNDGNYEPSNCKWATKFEQTRNRSNSWTLDQDQQLRDCLDLGFTYKRAAVALGKTEYATVARAMRLKLKSRRGSGGRLLSDISPVAPQDDQLSSK